MNEKSNVTSLRKYRGKRRLVVLRKITSLFTAFSISLLILLLSMKFIGYFNDIHKDPAYGYRQAKADLMGFKP
jgi:hypothetical protein